MRFAFIRAKKAEHSVSALCRVLEVTRQGYYRFEQSETPERAERERSFDEAVRAVFDESRGTYGSPRVHAQLRRQGVRTSRRRVERSMRAASLVARRKSRFVTTTRADASHAPAPNLLDRDFNAAKPNQRWVTDITYVWTDEGWAYLAVIIDLFSRRVVGWALQATLATSLPLAALHAALTTRNPHDDGLLFHSDRGCQYTSAEHRDELALHSIEPSMSRKGNCWDNAVAESFFATIKAELINDHRWVTRLELRVALFEYINGFYNTKRLHSALGYRAPAEVEREFRDH